jgi:hypothetical protein
MIKSKLLASTMLVSAAALVSAGSASAGKMKLGGYIEFWAGYGNNDKSVGNVNDFDIKQDAEINFSASQKLDNGNKVGVKFEMEAGNGNSGQTANDFDETSAYMQTSYGKFIIGNNDVASAYVGGVSVVGPIGITKSDAADWLPGSQALLNNTDSDLGAGDAGGISYFTPKVGGLQAIVSYVPDASDGSNSDFDDQETTGFHNHFSGALKYGAKIGGTGVSLAAGYSTRENTDTVGAASEDNGYGFTGAVTMKGLKVSATHASENNATDTDSYWAVAALYKSGKSSYSIGYSEAEADEKASGGKDVSDIITVGYQQSLGKGVTWASSIAHAGYTADATAEVDGTAVVTGIKIKF